MLEQLFSESLKCFIWLLTHKVMKDALSVIICLFVLSELLNQLSNPGIVNLSEDIDIGLIFLCFLWRLFIA